MITYQEFKQTIRRILWPYPGERQSLVEAHDAFFLRAMIDLCKVIPCLQQNHTDVHPACSTYVDCGKTVFDLPRTGIIKRVYTIANDDWCSKVFYDETDFGRVDCWSRNLLSRFTPSTAVGLPALQQGLKYADKSTDSRFGRSRVGLWAKQRKRLYVVPWIQSNEAVIVEWDGVKTDWKDEDLLDEDDWTADVAQAVQLYVAWCDQRDYGIADASPREESVSKADYEEARADLIWWCEQRTKQRDSETCCDSSDSLTAAQLAAEAVPDESDETVFAIIGDFGNDGANEALVSTLVHGWKPAFIVSTGDNWYGSVVALADLDAKVGKYYSDFLFPYLGSYGSGATSQKFFAAIGNHDRDPVGRLALETQYFNLPSNYYDFAVGPVHFFVLDTGYDSSQVNQEADGVDMASKQAIWLQQKLALSTAKWKLVIMHHPPFSSTKSAILTPPLAADGTISYPALQWPFRDWGANAVIFGHVHNYERLIDGDGMIYLANGAAGQAGQVPGEPAIFADVPLSISVLRYNTLFGAMRGTFDCDSLTLEFLDTASTVVDTVVLT